MVKYAGTSFAFKYLWGSVYKLGKGEIRTGEKKKKGKRIKRRTGGRRKGERRKGEKKHRGKGGKKKRRKSEKRNIGKIRLMPTCLLGLEPPEPLPNRRP